MAVLDRERPSSRAAGGVYLIRLASTFHFQQSLVLSVYLHCYKVAIGADYTTIRDNSALEEELVANRTLECETLNVGFYLLASSYEVLGACILADSTTSIGEIFGKATRPISRLYR